MSNRPVRLAEGLAFIFDLDGVIVNSMPMHTEAWRLYLHRHGIASDRIVEMMHGRRNDEIVGHFFGQQLTPDQIFQHGADKEALFREMIRPSLNENLVPGIAEFLRRSEQVPTGLASNAEPLNIDFVLDSAGIRKYFKAIVDGHQVARAKPFPDIYLRAAELLGVAPRNCIIFEDSPAGIEAAVQSGAQVVAVKTHPGDLPEVQLEVRDFLDPALELWLSSRERRA